MKKKKHLGWNFFHDFQADITMSRRNPLDDDPYEEIYKREENIERAIGCIHAFLATGRFDTYYQWYRGAYLQMDWDEERYAYLPSKVVKYYREDRKNLTLGELRKDFEETDEKEL